MNWKLTRPDNTVRFQRGEPICMVLPYPRGLLESCEPKCVPLSENQELEQAYRRWSAERDEFQERVAAGDLEAIEVGWQKDYFQGRDPGSEPVAGHQTRLSLRPFERDGEKITGEVVQPGTVGVQPLGAEERLKPGLQLMRRAVELHQAGDFAGARALYEEIVEIDKTHADAWHLLGVACHQLGENQRAVEVISRAISLQPNNGVFHSNRAAAWLALGEWNCAQEDYQRALQLAPTLADAHNGLAIVCNRTNRPAEAIDHFRRAIDLRPNFAEAHKNLGNALAKSGHYQQAVEHLRRAIELRPSFAEAQRSLEQLLALGNNPAQAVNFVNPPRLPHKE